MSCALWDVPCHIGSFLAPVQAFWATWWPLGLFVSGLIIGGILGWRVVLAVLTLGIGYFLYDRFKPVAEPIETDLSPRDREPAPKKKRTTIFDYLTATTKKGNISQRQADAAVRKYRKGS